MPTLGAELLPRPWGATAPALAGRMGAEVLPRPLGAAAPDLAGGTAHSILAFTGRVAMRGAKCLGSIAAAFERSMLLTGPSRIV